MSELKVTDRADSESTRTGSPSEATKPDEAPALPPVDWDSLNSIAYRRADVGIAKRYAEKIGLGIRSEECMRMLVRTLKMLHACDYENDDIVMTFACALTHVRQILPYVETAAPIELCSISILSVFIAHCVIIDEACPLIHWHKWIFKRITDMDALNKAIVKIMILHNHNLSVNPDERNVNFRYLFDSGC